MFDTDAGYDDRRGALRACSRPTLRELVAEDFVVAS